MTIGLFLLMSQAFAQDLYMTRNGRIVFLSKTPMEDIEAVNNEVTSILNIKTGEVVFAVLVKSFRFERALMEEHFNENYMESEKLPKSTFQGTITNLSAIDFGKEGSYPATVEGELMIHGVKKRIASTGTVTVGGGRVAIVSDMSIKPSDYDIEIPALVEDKIAKTIDVKINCEYAPRK